MKNFAPDYYKKFKCIGSSCRHNCCIGWEIGIDEVTLEKYGKIGGKLGQKLKENIEINQDGAGFRLDRNERCPFLNCENLCEIILSEGENALCEICTDHPRFRNFFSDRVETGLGLCCEEAGRLILGQKSKTNLTEFDENSDTPYYCEEENNFFVFRDELFANIQNRNFPISQRVKALCDRCGMNRSFIDCIDLFTSLEILDKGWLNLLNEIKSSNYRFSDEIKYSPFETEFEQLLMYFVYRHLPKILEGYGENNILRFILLLYSAVAQVFEYESRVKSKGDFESLVEIARMISAETEYSQENIDTLIENI